MHYDITAGRRSGSFTLTCDLSVIIRSVDSCSGIIQAVFSRHFVVSPNFKSAHFCSFSVTVLWMLWLSATAACINPLTPNDPYSGRTAPLTSKRCVLYIYSTNIGTDYFKRGIYCPFFFFPLQNAVCFIILTCSVHVLFTFYIQGVLK